MRPDGECFLDTCSTCATVRRGIGWLDADHGDLMACSILLQPEDEAAPAGITDRRCQLSIFDEIGYPQRFIGNEIVGCHKRVRRLSGEIFALPDDVEIAFCYLLSGLFAVLRVLLRPRKATMQAFEAFLRLPQVARIGNRPSLALGQERFQTEIDAGLLAGWLVLDASICLHKKLSIVAIGAANKAYPLDLFGGEGFDVAGANQPQSPDPAAIGERDVPAVRLKPPASLFVLDAAAIMLKLWVAFLPWLVSTALS